MVTVSFPWLAEHGCGCSFTRVELTTGETWREWDPCGAHMVLAATGYQPYGWPPERLPDRQPSTVSVAS